MWLKSFFRASFFALLCLPVGTFGFERDVVNAAESVAGVYSSIYAHELGHALAFKAFGASEVTIEVPRKGAVLGGLTSGVFPTPLSPSQRQWVAVSGLFTANLAGELVLQNTKLHGSPYAQSVLGTSIASNFIHVYQYYTRIRGVNGYTGNDIDQFELAGGNQHVFSAMLVTYSLWALQRMRKDDIPLFYVSLRF